MPRPANTAPAAARAAASRDALAGTARLSGQFLLSGRVTVAVRVAGEHVGQRVRRTWTFTPSCPAGPCAMVSLVRERVSGTDNLVLTLRSADYYVGSGRFFAPISCAGRRAARGEAVPFTITVRIMRAITTPAGAVATRVRATYRNRRRINRTRCVVVPGHDAAVYSGALATAASRRRAPQSPGARATAASGRSGVSGRSPAGS